MGTRATLAKLLGRALEAIAKSKALCNDAKIARAALKATRAVVILRRSAHASRSRAALSAIRARRRALGADAAARCATEVLDGKTEHRGDDDFVERAQGHHWARCLDRAHRDVRGLRRDSVAAGLYEKLLGLCLDLTKHDYADVRGAALETVDASFPLFGWVLKPKLKDTIHREFRGSFVFEDVVKVEGGDNDDPDGDVVVVVSEAADALPSMSMSLSSMSSSQQQKRLALRQRKRSSALVGAAALVASRSAMRKVTADEALGSDLLFAAVDFQQDVLSRLAKDDRDEAADRLDGVVALYASRHCRRPKDAGKLALKAADRARDPNAHWRRRFLAAFVSIHALSAATAPRRLEDDERQFQGPLADLWRSFVVENAVVPDDEPIARVALCALCKRVCLDAGARHSKSARRFRVGEASPGATTAMDVDDDDDAAAKDADDDKGCEKSGASKKTHDDAALRELVVSSFVEAEDADSKLAGLLGALRREHRRERARESDDPVATSSPIVDALLREAKHSEPWAVFPKTMAPYSSRGFRSRNARFLKRFVRLLSGGGGGGGGGDDPLSSYATRSQQEIEDEALARALQAEEEAQAASSRGASSQNPAPSSHAAPPLASNNSSRSPPRYGTPAPPPEARRQAPRDPLSAPPPREEVGLFRCGACSETMHVKNAVQGAQFQCPLCGRLNTI